MTQSGRSSYAIAKVSVGRSRAEAVWYGMNTHVIRVLNESPARLASTRVPSDGSVRFEVRDGPRRAILRLLGHGAKKELE